MFLDVNDFQTLFAQTISSAKTSDFIYRKLLKFQPIARQDQK